MLAALDEQDHKTLAGHLAECARALHSEPDADPASI